MTEPPSAPPNREWLVGYAKASRALFNAGSADPAAREDAQAALAVARLRCPASAGRVVAQVDQLFESATQGQGTPARDGVAAEALNSALKDLYDQLTRRDRISRIAVALSALLAFGGAWLIWSTLFVVEQAEIVAAAGGAIIVALALAAAIPSILVRDRSGTGSAFWVGSLLGFLAIVSGFGGLVGPALRNRPPVAPLADWTSAALIVAGTGAILLVVVLSNGSARLGQPAVRRRGLAESSVRLPSTGPGVDPAEIVAYQDEMSRLADIVAGYGETKRRSAQRWRAAYIAIGLPSAALAGAAGVTGAAHADTGWTVTLALAAAALTALSGALNPGKQWEATSTAADRCQSLVRQIDVMHELDTAELGHDARDAIENILTRLDQTLGVGEQPSFWSQRRAHDNRRPDEAPG